MNQKTVSTSNVNVFLRFRKHITFDKFVNVRSDSAIFENRLLRVRILGPFSANRSSERFTYISISADVGFLVDQRVGFTGDSEKIRCVYSFLPFLSRLTLTNRYFSAN